MHSYINFYGTFKEYFIIIFLYYSGGTGNTVPSGPIGPSAPQGEPLSPDTGGGTSDPALLGIPSLTGKPSDIGPEAKKEDVGLAGHHGSRGAAGRFKATLVAVIF